MRNRFAPAGFAAVVTGADFGAPERPRIPIVASTPMSPVNLSQGMVWAASR